MLCVRLAWDLLGQVQGEAQRRQPPDTSIALPNFQRSALDIMHIVMRQTKGCEWLLLCSHYVHDHKESPSKPMLQTLRLIKCTAPCFHSRLLGRIAPSSFVAGVHHGASLPAQHIPPRQPRVTPWFNPMSQTCILYCTQCRNSVHCTATYGVADVPCS